MPKFASFFRFFFTVTAIGILIMPFNSHSAAFEDLQSGLPRRIMTWTPASSDRIYTPQTIFGYINGGAEIYRAYSMRNCLSRRYTTTGGPDIILDIFDMGSSEEAYGVFTHDTSGDAVDIGQDGRIRPGWLNFWKDRFFISIYSEAETAAAQKAVRLLGERVDAAIETTGSKPSIINRLPPDGLQAASMRYFHHHVILNYHYYLSDENLLYLSDQTRSVLAEYRRKDGQVLILLTSYPKTDAARRAYANFKRHYLTDADDGEMVMLENQKWSALRIKGRLLVIILEADSRQLAENLLDSVDLVD